MAAFKLISSSGYTPKHLKRWSYPSNYMGPDHSESYIFLGMNRDSDALTRSNFECGLEAIGGTSDTVHQIRDSHWACGWIEYIIIDETDAEALMRADEVMGALKEYPVVNEDHFSQLEHDEACESINSNIDYFIRELCDELNLDRDELKKNEVNTLEAFVSAVFWASSSHHGYNEAWYCNNTARDIYEDAMGKFYMKRPSKRMLVLIEGAFGGAQ